MPKRCFDLITASIGLLITAPIGLLVALAIYLSDGRPVLFRQRRVGWRGRVFEVYKFRTMAAAAGAAAGSFDAGDASRVTRLGRWLRKTKLDELPQLWNVLRGDMSLVGPRPEVERWVAAYPERWKVVHSVRPGITDAASIMYRNEEELLAQALDPEEMYRREILPRKLKLYEEYVQRGSCWGDVWLILRTLAVVLGGPRLPLAPGTLTFRTRAQEESG